MKAKTQRCFRITFRIGEDDYLVHPLPIDPAVGSRAFRFAKQTGLPVAASRRWSGVTRSV